MYRKLSDTISINDNATPTEFLVNQEWAFVLPDGLDYEVNAEFQYLEGGIDLSGSVKPLVLKEFISPYEQPFCVEVSPHYDFFGNYATIVDCKYDNRFDPDNGMNSQKVIIDEPDFYVDLISVNTWPIGIDAQIRIRGEGIAPFNIKMMVNPEGDDHWNHIADFFREIANSIHRVAAAPKKRTSTKKTAQKVTDPNCIMDGTMLQRYTGNEADVVLPEGITALADNIFSGRQNLRSIVIPESVKTIGSRAFENCFSLQEVTLPKNLKELGHYAFVDCHELQSINLGNKLQSIESSIFSECFKLQNVTIPKTAKYIDAFAFKNCREFTKIIIPEGVTSIGFTAFTSCINLEYLYIPASVTGIFDNLMGDTPFGGCGKLTIYCPAGSYAEEYAKQHNMAYIIADSPEITASAKAKKAKSPTSFEAESTQDILTTAASSVLIDDEFETDDDTIEEADENGYLLYERKGSVLTEFWGCDKDSFVIPTGISEIADYAFSMKKDLKSIEIPDSVTSIGESAFSHCENLTSIVIPNSVTSIGDTAFWECTSLKNISISDNVTTIGKSMFKECTELKSVVIPDSVTTIEDWAFTDCANLTSIVIPESVTSISANAFYNTGKKLVLHVTEGSYAEKYAQEYGLMYDNKLLDAEALEQEQEVVCEEAKKIKAAKNERTYLLILANFWKNPSYNKEYEFPGDYELTFKTSKKYIDWKTSNRADDIEAEIDGLASVVNFACEFTSAEKDIGGMYDILVELYGFDKGDDVSNEFYAEIASAMTNDSATSLVLASVTLSEEKVYYSWILMDYLDLALTEGKEEWVISAKDAIQKAKAQMQELAKPCQEKANKRALEEARKASEEQRKKAEMDAERKRKEAEEAERKHKEELAAKRARYDEISDAISLQAQIISQNKGWFGAQAKTRKAAQEQLAILQAQLTREFPTGKP